MPGKDPKAKPEKTPDTHVNVVLVADLDMITDEFFHIREQGEVPTGHYFGLRQRGLRPQRHRLAGRRALASSNSASGVPSTAP